jgi:hypothetical protein
MVANATNDLTALAYGVEDAFIAPGRSAESGNRRSDRDDKRYAL